MQKKNPYLFHYMNLICHWEFGLGKKRFIYMQIQKIYENLTVSLFLIGLINGFLHIDGFLDLLNKGYPNVRLVSYDDFYEISSYTKEIFNFLSINQDNISFVSKRTKKLYSANKYR